MFLRTVKLASAKQVWGLNMTRKIIRRNEDTFWSPLPVRYGISRTSLYGTLVGLENLTPGRNLKVTPFVTAGSTRFRSAGNPAGAFTTDNDFDGGVDLKYSVTPSLTYAVGRAKRSLWTNSWIGALGTNRDSTIGGDFNRVYGADAHLEFYQRLLVDANLLRSDTPGMSGQDHARVCTGFRDTTASPAAGRRSRARRM